MKIGRKQISYKNYNKGNNTGKGFEIPKDTVILGQNNDNLEIMKRPLTNLKSMDTMAVVGIGSQALALAGVAAGAAIGSEKLVIASGAVGIIGALPFMASMGKVALECICCR